MLHELDLMIDAELVEMQAEYDRLWSWYLQRLARWDDESVE